MLGASSSFCGFLKSKHISVAMSSVNIIQLPVCVCHEVPSRILSNLASDSVTNWQKSKKEKTKNNAPYIKVIVFLFFSNQVQFGSVALSCLTLHNPMDHSMPHLPVHHQLLETAHTHLHRVGDAIEPSHLLLSPSPPAFNLSQHQDL